MNSPSELITSPSAVTDNVFLSSPQFTEVDTYSSPIDFATSISSILSLSFEPVLPLRSHISTFAFFLTILPDGSLRDICVLVSFDGTSSLSIYCESLLIRNEQLLSHDSSAFVIFSLSCSISCLQASTK